MVLRVDPLREGREALVEPDVGPALRCHRVAEPLVRDLVDHGLDVEDERDPARVSNSQRASSFSVSALAATSVLSLYPCSEILMPPPRELTITPCSAAMLLGSPTHRELRA